jgi:hypothetical protein
VFCQNEPEDDVVGRGTEVVLMYFPSGCENALQAVTALSPECIDGQKNHCILYYLPNLEDFMIDS